MVSLEVDNGIIASSEDVAVDMGRSGQITFRTSMQGGVRLCNVAEPTSASDAATRQFVEDRSMSLPSGGKSPQGNAWPV